MEAALEIEALSKRYRLDRQVGAIPVPTVFGFTVKEARRPGFEDDLDDDDDDDVIEEDEEEEERAGTEREIWALRDISLSLPAGESLAVIGPSGAGKSTLMKILASVTPPTEGQIRLRGRPSPLLSVTTTLVQPELTVVQNVRLLGDFFGVPRHVVARQMDTVLRFAELESRADMKLKRASIGMARQLGFSIGLNLEPALLLADGALGVGDAVFRKRCVARIEELCEQGRSLVLASDDFTLVSRMCQKALWLEDGRILQYGPTRDVIAAYGKRDQPVLAAQEADSHDRGNEFARLLRSRIVGAGDDPVDVLGPDDRATIEIEVEALRPVDVDFTVLLYADGQPPRPIRGPLDWRLERPGSAVARFDLVPGALEPGRYVARVGLWVSAEGRRLKLIQPNAFTFDVDDGSDDSDETRPFVGEPVHGAVGWRLDA